MPVSIAQPSYAGHKCCDNHYDDRHKSKSHPIGRTATKIRHSLAKHETESSISPEGVSNGQSFYICLSTQECCVKLLAIKYRNHGEISSENKISLRYVMSVTGDSNKINKFQNITLSGLPLLPHCYSRNSTIAVSYDQNHPNISSAVGTTGKQTWLRPSDRTNTTSAEYRLQNKLQIELF